ncbi:hypothetical protein [Gordonia sp. CPCC 205333]|uniref:hypothetical protein n=1 Tax=Gordonia sp. CPCC 205333 TaxID=3140790 RepID=UPI003AF3BBA5
MTELIPQRSYRNDDGTTETWWEQSSSEVRGVQIETTIKTLQRHDGEVIAEDVTLLLTDHSTPRRIGIPVAILDEVINALREAHNAVGNLNTQL